MSEQFSSVDDRRTTNNTDAVRSNYRVLSEAEKADVSALKDLGGAFLAKVESMGGSRELSLAKTKIEEAVMWAVKPVTAG